MERRHEFVLLAKSGEFTVTELCARFGIARKSAYSQQIRRFHQVPDKELPGELRDWTLSGESDLDFR